MSTTDVTHLRVDRTIAVVRRTGWGSALEGRPALGHIGPNWFACVMGTGIVANAAATLPASVPGMLVAARVVWVAALLLLIVVSVVTALHWLAHRQAAAAHLTDPVMAHFYGAPAMALMTVGAGALLLGQPVVGSSTAIALDALLWTAGTALGLVTAVLVPFKTFTTHRTEPDSAFGGWLMPVVPPMVSAATGPLLVAHLPAGQWRLALQLACTMMFGVSLVASLVIITLIWGRLAQHKVGAAAAVPTLWIVLGPLGQSITAAHNIGATAADVLPGPYATGFSVLALVYGLPMWGFAMLWLVLAVAITIHTARRGLPFSMTWWSFTFPVGTVVTGTSGLAAITGADFLVAVSLALYVALVLGWLVVGTRTARGVYSGSLLRAPGDVP